MLKTMEARVGIEPTNKGFADLGICSVSSFLFKQKTAASRVLVQRWSSETRFWAHRTKGLIVEFKESDMGRERDVVVPADALDSMISKLEEALVGLEGVFAGVWSYLLPDTKICVGELELIREVIKALKQRAAEGQQAF